VLFARLLLQDAPVILLDEPFNAIDERTTADLLALLHRWHGEGRTVVAVLHDLAQVRAHFPRTLLLAREPIAWGPTAAGAAMPQHLSARPPAWPSTGTAQAPWNASGPTPHPPPHPPLQLPSDRRHERSVRPCTGRWCIAPFIEFGFMRRALVACLALGLSRVRRWGTLLVLAPHEPDAGDAMAHALLPGAAVGLPAGGRLSAAGHGSLGALHRRAGGGRAGRLAWRRFTTQREDASFAAFYLIALAAGVLILSSHGSPVDLMHVLFGSVLGVDDLSLVLIAAVATVTVLVLALLARPLVILIADPAFLRSVGVPARALHLAFLALVVLNLVAGFQAMGTLMAVGLMMLPAVSARFWSRTLGGQLAAAVVVALLATLTGLLLSMHQGLPSGPAIVLTAGAAYLLSLLLGPQDSLLSRQLARRGHRAA
jgi:zinc/manganese transport system permease protein